MNNGESLKRQRIGLMRSFYDKCVATSVTISRFRQMVQFVWLPDRMFYAVDTSKNLQPTMKNVGFIFAKKFQIDPNSCIYYELTNSRVIRVAQISKECVR